MYLRNLMAMDTEEMIRAQPMDSVIVIGGCDKTLPAQVMAAISADLPTVVIPVGPMVVGHHKGEVLGACTDCRRLWAQHRAGKIDEAEIEVVSGRLAPSVGTCMVMGTASTMACVVEALGFSLPYAAAIPAVHAERIRIAEASGRQAVAVAKAGSPRPRELFTERALRNALIVLQAVGGSTNGVVHLAAMAGRAGIKLDLDAFDALSRKVPVLIDLKPSGDHYMEHFHHAGGVPRLMQELSDILDLDVPTVAGTLRDHVKVAEQVPGQTVIRSRKNPINPQGAMCVLRGNLAPRGAVIKQSAATPESAVGGPLALVQTGDRIRLDVPKRSIELLVDDAELKRRAALFTPPPAHAGSDRGYSWLFQSHITQADEGCDFDFLSGRRK